jgi:hypothetical protein
VVLGLPWEIAYSFLKSWIVFNCHEKAVGAGQLDRRVLYSNHSKAIELHIGVLALPAIPF